MYMNIKYYILLVFIYKFMSIKDKKKKKQINTNFIISLLNYITYSKITISLFIR